MPAPPARHFDLIMPATIFSRKISRQRGFRRLIMARTIASGFMRYSMRASLRKRRYCSHAPRAASGGMSVAADTSFSSAMRRSRLNMMIFSIYAHSRRRFHAASLAEAFRQPHFDAAISRRAMIISGLSREMLRLYSGEVFAGRFTGDALSTTNARGRGH